MLLNAVFGAALVRGYQGDDPSKQGRIGACVKHFVGYGAALGGRDYQFTELSERALRETYLPPFKACVDAGAVSVMSAFNDISGTPLGQCADAGPDSQKRVGDSTASCSATGTP